MVTVPTTLVLHTDTEPGTEARRPWRVESVITTEVPRPTRVRPATVARRTHQAPPDSVSRGWGPVTVWAGSQPAVVSAVAVSLALLESTGEDTVAVSVSEPLAVGNTWATMVNDSG